ncbi:hypothetical protein TRFO_07849 [Tritrichomonas foetus]|uniref:FUZ/MON1/HPS1 first Longin domain-containing protein n=1 Tax=Tritrichomonas foetus TaxID=1144522 RepID=A0A1J4JP72_9EUKA|nr:hypothetical protein TRFO_07849 [Tritrichomonas foetus]|eukprot:OHT00538.1 hypothetical protein TRFO_07849 [Tritrichomonas foetus]
MQKSPAIRRSATADNFNKNRFSVGDIKEIRCFDENPRDESWTRHERHFFIITDASRPVYCRYGNELNVTPLLCTIVAFTGQLVRDGNQKLQTIVAGNKLFVFYLPLPFIFVCVSSVKLPVSLLMKELQVLELIIFSILTPHITQTLQRRPNFDIKKQTSGSERYFTSALELMDQSQSFIFHDCISMAAVAHQREQYARVVKDNFTKNIYACVAFYQGDLFFYVETKDFHMTPDDILILLNNSFPSSTESITSWAPLCLPNREEMFHILTVYAKEDFDFTMLFISDQIEMCPQATKMSESIIRDFKTLISINRPDVIEPIENTDIFHFTIANHRIGQVYSPIILSQDLSKVIYRSYTWAYEYLKTSPISGPFYIATDELTLFGHHANDETLIAATHVGCSAQNAQSLLDELDKYIQEHKSEIFDFSPLKFEE